MSRPGGVRMTDALATSRTIFDELAGYAGEPRIAMRAWTGETWGPSDAPATIVLQHPGALRALFVPPNDLTAGEAYIFNDIDLEGDILAALDFAVRLENARGHRLRALSLMRKLRSLPAANRRLAHIRPAKSGRLHSKRRDARSVTAHYNTGNEFFQLFLDPLMVYSCAAFLDPSEPLIDAQQRKLDLICRKLDLQPGQRMLDIGCGWGALAIHAARDFDVEVLGVTLSAPQAELAKMRAKEAMVEDRVEFRLLDYRDVQGSFDAISSVGMFEHVGSGQLGRYFSHVAELLESDGLFLNHGIVTRDRHRTRTTPTFVNTYVFPDGELETVDDVVGRAEDAGFELRDAESLRTSYAITLRHWVANIQANREAAIVLADDVAYRIWRLYMAGAVLGFETAGLSVYQLLLRRPGRPWRFGRSHLLAEGDTPWPPGHDMTRGP